MAVIRIELEERDKRFYDIIIGKDLGGEIEKLVEGLEGQKRGVVFLVDNNVTRNMIGNKCMLMHGGEENKSLEAVQECYQFLVDNKVDRKGVLFVMGGGVVGDVGGFVAATYMRGVDYYQVPTTLLSMVDSAIGGKTGVNLGCGKNLVGAFYQPKGVFIDINFLKTLPAREFAAGMAEVIKYALIADGVFFEEIERGEPINKDFVGMVEIIEKCCKIKQAIVQADERDEKGVRSCLNFGHTFGHAIENVAGYGEYLHGEAVSIGMMMGARLSELLGYLTRKEVQRIKLVLEKYGLPVKLKGPLKIAELNRVMRNDKKQEGGILRFIVLKRVGEASEMEKVNEKWIERLWVEAGAKEN